MNESKETLKTAQNHCGGRQAVNHTSGLVRFLPHGALPTYLILCPALRVQLDVVVVVLRRVERLGAPS